MVKINDVDTTLEVLKIIGEACGGVSMCWNPTPIGVFDSEQAGVFVDEALNKLKELFEF